MATRYAKTEVSKEPGRQMTIHRSPGCPVFIRVQRLDDLGEGHPAVDPVGDAAADPVGRWQGPSPLPVASEPCADLRRLDPSSGDTIAVRTAQLVTSATVTSGSIVAHMDAGICDPDFLGDHRLVVRDQATLEILWTAKLDSLSNVAPTIADGRIYVNQAGTVLAYDAAGCGAPSCLPVWTTTGDGIAVNDPVVAANGQVYLRRSFRVEVPPNGVFEHGRLEVLDADDGIPLWQAPYSVGTDPGDAAGVDEIAATGDRIYVVAYRNQGGGTPVQRVLALAADGCGAATCRPLASVPVAVGVVQHMVISGGRVLVVGQEADGSQTLAAFGVP